MDIIDSARDRSTVAIIDVIDSAGDWSSIFITLECSQTRYRSSITVIVVIYSPGVLSRLLVRGNISSLLTMVFMVLSRTVLGRALEIFTFTFFLHNYCAQLLCLTTSQLSVLR